MKPRCRCDGQNLDYRRLAGMPPVAGPYSPATCGVCWAAANHSGLRARWGLASDGLIVLPGFVGIERPLAQPASATRVEVLAVAKTPCAPKMPLCIELGSVIDTGNRLCQATWLFKCNEGHGGVRPGERCHPERCGDYEPPPFSGVPAGVNKRAATVEVVPTEAEHGDQGHVGR